MRRWLEQQAPADFPDGRIRVFAHGQQNPLAPNRPNSSESGRARNRRVEIVIGTTTSG